MSWAQDEWKYNLPHVALQKIDALEHSIEQLRKDQQQKKFQIESLEASFENQKKKTEKEKSEVGVLKKDIHALEEQRRQSQIDYDKALHDLQTKDNRISCLDGQLIKVKRSLEQETTKVSKLSVDLEQAISERNKKVDLLQQKEQDIQKLSKRLQLSSSDDVFTKSGSIQSNDAVSLISFDEPEDSANTEPNLLHFTDQPVTTPQNKSSNTSQQSTTFNLFGDDFETSDNKKTLNSTVDTTAEVNELKSKITSLQEKLQQYEQDAMNYKTFRKDAELKLQQIKSEFDGKSNECAKLENEILMVTVKFEEEQVKNVGLDRGLKQLQKTLECERHNSQATLQVQEEKTKEQEKRMREEVALEEKAKKDEIQAVQKEMTEIEKKHNDMMREYQTLERTHFQTNNEKEALKIGIEDANQTISQLKSDHHLYFNDMKQKLEEAHKKQIASYDIKIQELQREMSTVQTAANNLKNDCAASEKTIGELNSKCVQLEDYKEKAEKKLSQLSKLSEENERQATAKIKELETNYRIKLKNKEEAESVASKSLKEASNKVEELTKEVTVKKQANEDLQFKVASFESHLNKLKKEKEENDKEHNIFTRETEQREKELVQNFEKAKHEAKVSKEREQLAKDSQGKLTNELENSKQRLVDSERTTNEVQQKLANAENDTTNIVNQLQALKHERDELSNQNQNMENEKMNWEQRLTEKDTILSKLTGENNELKSSHAESQSSIQQLTEANAVKDVQIKDAETSVKNINQENKEITTTLETLKIENETVTSKCNDITTKLDQSQQAYHEMCKKNQTIERDFQEQYIKLKDELANTANEIDRLREQNNQREEAIECLQKSKTRSDSEVECLTEEIEHLRAEHKKFQETHDDLNAQLKDTATKLHLHTERCEQFQSLLKEKDKKVETLLGDLARVEQDKQIESNALKDSIREFSIKAEELENEVKVISTQKDSLQTDNKALTDDYQSMSNELIQLSVLYENVKNEKDQMATEIETSQQKSEESANMLQSKETALEQLNGQLETLHDDLRLKTRSYEELLAEKNHVRNQLQMAHDELEDTNSAIQEQEEKSQASAKEYNCKIDQLSADIELKDQEIEKLHDNMKELQSGLHTLEELVKIKTEELTSSFQSIEQSNNQVNLLTSELSDANQAKESLQGELSEANQAKESLQGELSESNQAKESLQGELSEANQAKETLQGELSEANQAKSTLRGELSKANQAKETLHKNFTNASREVADKSEELSGINNELITLKEEYEKLVENQQENERQICAANGEKSLMEEQLNVCKLRLDTMTEEMVELSSTKESLTLHLEEKNKEIEQKSYVIADLDASLVKETDTNKQLSVQLSDKDQTLESMEKQLENITSRFEENQEKHESLANDFESIVKQLDDKESCIKNLETAVGIEKENIQSLKNEIELKSREIDTTQNRVFELQNTLEEERNRVESITEDLETKSRDLESKESRIADIEATLATERETVRIQFEDNQIKSNELATKEEDIAQLQRRLTDGNLERNNLAENLESVKQQLVEKEHDIGELQTSMGEEKRKLEEEFTKTLNNDQEIITALRETIEELQSHKQNTEEEISILKCDNEKLQQDQSALRDLQEKYALSEADRASLFSTVNVLQENLLTKETEVQKWKQCEENFDKQISTLNGLNEEIVSCKDEEISGLKEECKILNEKLELYVKDGEDIQSLMEEQKKARALEFEQVKAEADKQLEDLKSELLVAQEKASDKENRLDDLMSQCEGTDEIILNLKTENLSLHERHAEEEKKILKELEQVKETLNKKQAQIKGLMDSKGTMQSKIVTYASQIDTLQNKIRHCQNLNAEQAAKHHQQINESTKQIENKGEEIATLTDTCNQLKVDYENQINELGNSASTLQAMIEEKEHANEQLRLENRDIEKKITNLEELYAKSQQDLGKQQKSHEQLTAELEAAKREFETGVENLESALKQTKSQYVNEVDAYKNKVETLQVLCENHEGEIQNKNSSLRESSEKIYILEEERSTLEATVSEQQETIIQKDDVIMNNKTTSQQQEENLNALKIQLEESEVKCNQLSANLEEKIEVCSKKESTIVELGNSKELLEQDLEQMECKYKELFEEHTDLRHKSSETVTKAQHDIGTKDREIQTLKTDLQETESNCQSIQNELTRVFEETESKTDLFGREKLDLTEKLEKEANRNSLQRDSISQLNSRCTELEDMLDQKTKEFESTHQETIEQYQCFEKTYKQEKEGLEQKLDNRVQEISTLNERLCGLQETYNQTNTELNTRVTTVTELRSTMEERDSEIDSLQRNIRELESQLKGKIESLEKSGCTASELEQQIYTLQEVNASLTKLNDESTEKRKCIEKELQQKMESSQCEIVTLKQSIDDFESKIEELGVNIKNHTTVNVEQNNRIEEQATVISDLESQLATTVESLQQHEVNSEEEKELLNGKISTGETVIKELNEMNKTLKETVQEKESEVSQLTTNMEHLKTSLGVLEVEKTTVSEKIRNLEAVIEEKEQLNDTSLLEKDELYNQINELSSKFEELELALESSEKMFAEEKRLSASCSEELTLTKINLENLHSDFATLEEKLRSELELSGTQRQQHENRETELKERLSTVEKETEENADQLKHVETMKEELTQELLEAKEKLRTEVEKSQKLEVILEEHEADFETLQEKLDSYKKTMKCYESSKVSLEQQLSDKNVEIDRLTSAIGEVKENSGKESEELKENIQNLINQLEQFEKDNDELKGEREHLKSECEKLRICFNTLNEENKDATIEKEHAQSEIERLNSLLKSEGDKLRKLRNELNYEKENNVCNKAEVSNLNFELEDVKKATEKEKRKLKKLLQDLEKKDISFAELEKDLLVQKENFSTKKLELQDVRKQLAEVEINLSLEIEKNQSKQQKLDDIKLRLLTKSNNNNGAEDTGALLDESIDFNSHILQLQGQIALMESDKRKCVDDAVQGERLQIVESTKTFVMEREKAHESETRGLRDELELKDKKIENIQTKLKHMEDECKEKDYALEQEKKACEELLKAAEEKNSRSKTRRRSSANFNGDEIRELQERLEQAKLRNGELKEDFAKTVDDHDKVRTKEKRDVEKLKSQHERLKAQYEQKDIELKRYLSLGGKDQLENGKLVKELRSRLVSSDEKFVEIQLTNEDLQKKIDTIEENRQKEITALNRRLATLLDDNERLRKKVKELQNSLNASEKENLKMKQERAAYPFAKSSVSPLARSLSALNVVSSEDSDSNNLQKKSAETPKRVNEEFLPSKSKRVRIYSVVEEEVKTTKPSVAPSVHAGGGKRRSSRLANKPYRREIMTSSSEDETKIDHANQDKENPTDPFLNRTNQFTFPLATKKNNSTHESVLTLPRKKLPVSNLAVSDISNQMKIPPGPTRVTRSSTAEEKLKAHAENELNKNNTLNARKHLRSQSSSDDEKCNMQ